MWREAELVGYYLIEGFRTASAMRLDSIDAIANRYKIAMNAAEVRSGKHDLRAYSGHSWANSVSLLRRHAW